MDKSLEMFSQAYHQKHKVFSPPGGRGRYFSESKAPRQKTDVQVGQESKLLTWWFVSSDRRMGEAKKTEGVHGRYGKLD